MRLIAAGTAVNAFVSGTAFERMATHEVMCLTNRCVWWDDSWKACGAVVGKKEQREITVRMDK